MDVKQISETLSVSGQVEPDDVPNLAALGFRSLICNRPDGESADQTSFADIRAAAEQAGLEAVYIPVSPGNVTADDAGEFATALSELPGPVLAYCRTGNRSSILWRMAQQRG